MDVSTKIKLAREHVNMPEAELARRLGVSAQSLYQRLKTGKFSSAELAAFAEAMGAELIFGFRFPDGAEI